MERSCQTQIMALSCNTKLVFPPESVAQKTYETMQKRSFAKPGDQRGVSAWPGLLRKLDKIDPSYKD